MMRAQERWWRPGEGLRTIRWQLTLWYVVLLALALLMFSTFLYLSLSHNLYLQLDRRLQTEQQQVIDALDLDEERPELEDLEDLPPGMIVSLYDRTGERL